MLDSPAMQALIARAHKHSLPPRHMIMMPGHAPRSLCLILQGSVTLTLEDPDGRELVVGYLNEGDVLGEGLLFPDEELANMAARTRGPVLVAEIGRAGFMELCREYPELLLAFSGQLVQRLRMLSQRVAELAFLDVTGRLAQTLQDLSQRPEAGPHPRGNVVRISRVELARHVGCSREMVGRALKKLFDEDLARPIGRNILVIDGCTNFAETRQAA